MSEIEWSPWIKNVAGVRPSDSEVRVQVRFRRGDKSVGHSRAWEWPHWDRHGGDMEITHYRIPMEDYRRITGMPEWSDAPEWAQWLAQDEDGKWWFYREPVQARRYQWVEMGYPWGPIISRGQGTVLGDWSDTLQERPAEPDYQTGEGRCKLGFHEDPDNSGLCIRCSADLDDLDTHPDSELDADQYSVGADTFPEDAADEIVKRAQKRNLNPYDAAGFLHAALGHMEDRKTTYDAPEGERSMGKTVAAFNAIAGHDLSEEEGWLFMVLLKAVRTQQGGFRADNYEDGAAYFGLQGEAAAKERGSE